MLGATGVAHAVEDEVGECDLGDEPGFVDTPMTRDFPKGLLWASPETIARGIEKAIDRRKDVVYLPWFWRPVMRLIREIPEPIFKKLRL